jgi:hypothetical protein
MEKLIIKISEDFSKITGPRLIDEGEFSGEAFYNEVLLPKYQEAIEKKIKLVIDLDGTYGYGTSFLEESFGGLVRSGFKDVLQNIEIVSDEEDYLIDDIKKYIKEAEDQMDEK